MTYRDMTFCADICRNLDCPRNIERTDFTPDRPVSMSFFAEACQIYIPPEPPNFDEEE